MTKDEIDQLRRELLIPATFGIHSKIYNDLRDYISRTFDHSTFSFHEAYLDRPIQWRELFQKAIAGSGTGTTEPFLSRFVHQSGLTPKLDPDEVSALRRKRQTEPTFDPLQIPLVATSKGTYHEGLEQLAFSLEDSIILRGLLQIWLAVQNGGSFEAMPPAVKQTEEATTSTLIEHWQKAQVFIHPLGPVDFPTRHSKRSVSLVGRLSSEYIKKFYADAVNKHLDETNNIEAADKKVLALLREYPVT